MLKLWKGDCLERVQDIADNSIDLILTDLPFGTTNCVWDIVIPFEPLWEQYRRILKSDGIVLLFGVEPFSSHLRLSNLKWFKYDWIWEKSHATGFLNSKRMPMKAHEIISVFYQKSSKYYPIKTLGHTRKVAVKRVDNTPIYGKQTEQVSYDATDRFPRTVIKFPSDKQRLALHPTQKPVALLEYLIKTYTLEDDTVLDSCAGSFSTGVACLNTGRSFIGIEKDPTYFKLGRQRILEHKQKLGKNKLF